MSDLKKEKHKAGRVSSGMVMGLFPPVILLICLVLLGIGNVYIRAQNAEYTVRLETLRGDEALIEGIGFSQDLLNEDQRLRWETQTRYLGEHENPVTGEGAHAGTPQTEEVSTKEWRSADGVAWTSEFHYYPDEYRERIEYETVQIRVDYNYVDMIAGIETDGEGAFYREYYLKEYIDTIPMRIEIDFMEGSYYGEGLFGTLDNPNSDMYPVVKMPEDAVVKVERKGDGKEAFTGIAYATGVSYENISGSVFDCDCVRIGDMLYFTLITAKVVPASSDGTGMEYEGYSGLYRMDIKAYQQARKKDRLAEATIELLYSIPVSSEQDFQIMGLSLLDDSADGRMILMAKEQADLILFCLDGNGTLLSKGRYEGLLPGLEKGRLLEQWDFASEAGDTWFFITRDNELKASAWSVDERGMLTYLSSVRASAEEYEEHSIGRMVVDSGEIWDAVWHNGQICLLMTAFHYEKHETSPCVLVPGEEKTAYLGRFQNSMDEDQTIAAANSDDYGVFKLNGARCGYRLAFLRSSFEE